MMRKTRHIARGFSLIEAMVAIVVMAIVAAIVAPVVTSATDVYAASAATRRTTERAGFAVERIVRFVRQIPPGAVSGTVAINTATSESMTLASGAAVSLVNGELILTDADGVSGVLCEDVESFELQFLAEDGTTSTVATPTLTRRINITLRAGGMTIVSGGFIRAGASL